MIQLHSEIPFGHNKEGNLTLCDSIDGPRKYYAMWNKPSEKDKYHMTSLICGI